MTVVASNYELKQNSFYPTEAWATRAVLQVLQIGSGLVVWECAAGDHQMADVIAETGAEVVTSDIATYGPEHDFDFDFLSDNVPFLVPDVIITNPPYGKQNREAVKFAEKALARCDGYVALLLTAKFDSGSSRKHLFQDNSRWAAKIVLTDRISWEGNGKTGTEDHAWYIWRPAIDRMHREPVIYYKGREECGGR
ncbi:hypothetical protein ABE527_14270 [Brucella sp. TWI432]